MIRTSRTIGEPRAGCSKRPAFSPAQPWRLLHPPALSLPRQPLRPGTRLVPSKAAAARLTLVSRFTVLGSEARTPLGERCVLAHLGEVGENRDFFSILLESTVPFRQRGDGPWWGLVNIEGRFHPPGSTKRRFPPPNSSHSGNLAEAENSSHRRFSYHGGRWQ